MGLLPELVTECKRRQKEPSYVDCIAVSVRISYVDGKGKTRYKERQFSGGSYSDWYAHRIIEDIETENNLPLRKLERDYD